MIEVYEVDEEMADTLMTHPPDFTPVDPDS